MGNTSTLLDPDQFAEIVGRNIRSVLAMRGMQAKTLAELIGKSDAALSQRMGGHSRWLAIDLHRIAKVLEVDMDVLLAADQAEFVDALTRSRCEASFGQVSGQIVPMPGQGVLALAS